MHSKIKWAWIVSLVAAICLSASLLAQSTHALIVTSASGEDQFKEQFWDWGMRLKHVLTEQMRVPKENVLFLFEDPSKGASLVFGKSTRSELTRAAEELGGAAKAGDLVLIVLLGHGSYDGLTYKFNLVGPDVTTADLEQLLDRFSRQQVVLVAATPCSGGLTRTLAGKNRVIMAATKSELENNQTVFGGFFVEAFENQVADSDKSGRVSMLEAYLFARKKVEDWYEERQKLATEHPLLEDDGNGRASSVPSPQTGDGLLAGRLSPGPAIPPALAAYPVHTEGGVSAGNQKELRELQAAKRKVEADIAALKYRKSSMEEAEYQKDLEKLLLELARTDNRIRELEKPK
ncbi:MAG: hypothetical protein ACE15E_06140 [Acidobacteriota bacterium]